MKQNNINGVRLAQRMLSDLGGLPGYVTRHIVDADKLLDTLAPALRYGASAGVDVLYHLVIGNGSRWVSLKERGLGF